MLRLIFLRNVEHLIDYHYISVAKQRNVEILCRSTRQTLFLSQRQEGRLECTAFHKYCPECI